MYKNIRNLTAFIALTTVVIAGALFVLMSSDRQLTSTDVPQPDAKVRATIVETIVTSPTPPSVAASQSDEISELTAKRLAHMANRIEILAETVKSLSDQIQREAIVRSATDPDRSGPNELVVQQQREREKRAQFLTRANALEARITSAEAKPDTSSHLREKIEKTYADTGGGANIQELNCTSAGCVIRGVQSKDPNSVLDLELAVLASGAWTGTSMSSTNVETGEITIYLTH